MFCTPATEFSAGKIFGGKTLLDPGADDHLEGGAVNYFLIDLS
jgi:hypothetical protein